MENTSDDDLEVAAVLAKGLGPGLSTEVIQKVSDVHNTGRLSTVSPKRSSTVLTNHSRGNTATVTPSVSICDNIHQLAARGELLTLKQIIDDNQVNERDQFGLTPLMWAAMYGQSDVVTFLLRLGAHPDSPDSQGVMPLMTACYHGNVDVVKVLLKSQIVIDMEDHEGNTALLYAVFGNHRECAQLLLEKGADLTNRNDQGICALDAAIRLQHKPVQKAIEQYMMKALDGT